MGHYVFGREKLFRGNELRFGCLHSGDHIETLLRSGYRKGIDEMLLYVVRGCMQIRKT